MEEQSAERLERIKGLVLTVYGVAALSKADILWLIEQASELDRIRAALAERDRILGEAVELICAAPVPAGRFDYKRKRNAFLSAYDASKKEKV